MNLVKNPLESGLSLSKVWFLISVEIKSNLAFSNSSIGSGLFFGALGCGLELASVFLFLSLSLKFVVYSSIFGTLF